MTKRYSELIQFGTFEERFEYLKLTGAVGESTFGSGRYLNQLLYKSPEWKSVRQKVIIRDNGCDLGISDRQLDNYITIHHINPISKEDILNRNPKVFDLENLISCSDATHKAIHYGDISLLPKTKIIERKPFDQCPWH